MPLPACISCMLSANVLILTESVKPSLCYKININDRFINEYLLLLLVSMHAFGIFTYAHTRTHAQTHPHTHLSDVVLVYCQHCSYIYPIK